MKMISKLLSAFARVLSSETGDRRAIPRHPDDGTSTLAYGEVRRAAVALHGAGTKVRIWRDGSGHLLPPPPYREEEWLYSFDNEFQLRRLLPALGVMALEEWKPERFGQKCSTLGCKCTGGIVDGLCFYCRS